MHVRAPQPHPRWGVASQIFLADYHNYTNAQFDRARAAQAHAGMFKGPVRRGDYNTTINSWKEQRLFVTARRATPCPLNPPFGHVQSAVPAHYSSPPIPLL